MNHFDKTNQVNKISLNRQQKEAATHKEGPALVLAGPGSGKTTVIVSRTARLVKEMGIDPGNILTLTYNRAAKIEMENRFRREFKDPSFRTLRFSTIHSFCNSVVAFYERKRGGRLKRIEGGDGAAGGKRKIIREIYQDINGTQVNDDELENVISEISYVKNKMIKDFEGYKASARNFSQVFKIYESYKKSNLMLDFDDMLTYTHIIFSRFPDILQYYRDKYRYIQIDEGQDLSNIQYEIIRSLAKPHDNLFIVADDDQSIYGFRGAEPELILSVEKEFPRCSIYHLENNYRSTANIVSISSSFIRKNIMRFDKTHFTENALKADPLIVQPRDEAGQLKFLTEEVKRLAQRENKSVGILYRNNLSSILTADAFEREKVEFGLKQSRLFFFDHWAVLDILSFFKFGADQEDREAFLRICFKMNRFISKGMVEHALNSGPPSDNTHGERVLEEYGLDADNTIKADSNKSESGSIIDRMLTFHGLKPFQVTRLKDLKEEFKALNRRTTADGLRYIEYEFKYLESAREYCDSFGLSFEYIYRLFGILKNLAVNYPNIQTFLLRIKELQEIFENSASCSNINPKPDSKTISEAFKNKPGVTLTTIHSSKGLEYDSVFLTDLNENEIPGRKAAEALDKSNDRVLMEEERRLFYVGMTRAKEDLYLLSPQNINGEPVPLSPFAEEVINQIMIGKTGQFQAGKKVEHRHFGIGIIKSVSENENNRPTVEIDFAGSIKKLDLIICIKNRLLNSLN